MRCPGCGRTEEEVSFIGFVCVDCYRKKEGIEEEEIRVKVCPTCGRMKIKQWREFSLSTVARHLKKRYGRTFTPVGEEDNSILFASPEGEEIRVDIVYEQCPACARMAGGYYESVIQVRGRKREEAEERVMQLLLSEKDPFSFVSKTERRKEGVDIYVGSRKVARKVARVMRKRYGAVVKYSFTQVGTRDGRPLFRETVLIRLD